MFGYTPLTVSILPNPYGQMGPRSWSSHPGSAEGSRIKPYCEMSLYYIVQLLQYSSNTTLYTTHRSKFYKLYYKYSYSISDVISPPRPWSLASISAVKYNNCYYMYVIWDRNARQGKIPCQNTDFVEERFLWSILDTVKQGKCFWITWVFAMIPWMECSEPGRFLKNDSLLFSLCARKGSSVLLSTFTQGKI